MTPVDEGLRKAPETMSESRSTRGSFEGHEALRTGNSVENQKYLEIRYSKAQRPYTDYPGKLARYLTEQYLGDYRETRLVDLGSGRGEFLHGFAELGFDALGIDRALPTDDRFPEPVLQADFTCSPLPLENESVSVLFNKSVFEHVWDITHLLDECRRVLVPGGRMISMVPDWKSQLSSFYDDWTHVRPFTLTGLSECLSCHGFELRDARHFRQLPFLWKRPYLRPLASAAARMPSFFTERSKLVKFAKGWMLLVVSDKPTRPARHS